MADDLAAQIERLKAAKAAKVKAGEPAPEPAQAPKAEPAKATGNSLQEQVDRLKATKVKAAPPSPPPAPAPAAPKPRPPAAPAPVKAPPPVLEAKAPARTPSRISMGGMVEDPLSAAEQRVEDERVRLKAERDYAASKSPDRLIAPGRSQLDKDRRTLTQAGVPEGAAEEFRLVREGVGELTEAARPAVAQAGNLARLNILDPVAKTIGGVQTVFEDDPQFRGGLSAKLVGAAASDARKRLAEAEREYKATTERLIREEKAKELWREVELARQHTYGDIAAARALAKQLIERLPGDKSDRAKLGVKFLELRTNEILNANRVDLLADPKKLAELTQKARQQALAELVELNTEGGIHLPISQEMLGETSDNSFKAAFLPRRTVLPSGEVARGESVPGWALNVLLSLPSYATSTAVEAGVNNRLPSWEDYKRNLADRRDILLYMIEQDPNLQADIASGDWRRVTSALKDLAPALALELYTPDTATLALKGASAVASAGRGAARMGRIASEAARIAKAERGLSGADVIRRATAEVQRVEELRRTTGAAADVILAVERGTELPQAARVLLQDEAARRVRSIDPRIGEFLDAVGASSQPLYTESVLRRQVPLPLRMEMSAEQLARIEEGRDLFRRTFPDVQRQVKEDLVNSARGLTMERLDVVDAAANEKRLDEIAKESEKLGDELYAADKLRDAPAAKAAREAEIQRIKDAEDAAYDAARKKYDAEVEAQRQQEDTTYRAARQAYEDDLDRIKKAEGALYEKARQEHAAEVERVKRAEQAEFEAAKKRHDAEILRIKGEEQAAFEAAKRAHTAELERIAKEEKSAAEAVRQQKAAERTRIAAEKKAADEAVRQQKAAERTRIAEQEKAAARAAKERHAAEMERLNREEQAAFEAARKQYRDDLARIKAAEEAAYTAARQEHAAELQRIKAAEDALYEKARAEHAAELERIAREERSAVEAAKQQRAAEVARIEKEEKAAAEAARQQHAAEGARIAREEKAVAEAARRQYAAELTRIAREEKAAVETAKMRVAEAEKRVRDLDADWRRYSREDEDLKELFWAAEDLRDVQDVPPFQMSNKLQREQARLRAAQKVVDELPLDVVPPPLEMEKYQRVLNYWQGKLAEWEATPADEIVQMDAERLGRHMRYKTDHIDKILKNAEENIQKLEAQRLAKEKASRVAAQTKLDAEMKKWLDAVEQERAAHEAKTARADDEVDAARARLEEAKARTNPEILRRTQLREEAEAAVVAAREDLERVKSTKLARPEPPKTEKLARPEPPKTEKLARPEPVRAEDFKMQRPEAPKRQDFNTPRPEAPKRQDFKTSERPEAPKREDFRTERPEAPKMSDFRTVPAGGAKAAPASKAAPPAAAPAPIEQAARAEKLPRPEGPKRKDFNTERPEGPKRQDFNTERPEAPKREDFKTTQRPDAPRESVFRLKRPDAPKKEDFRTTPRPDPVIVRKDDPKRLAALEAEILARRERIRKLDENVPMRTLFYERSFDDFVDEINSIDRSLRRADVKNAVRRFGGHLLETAWLLTQPAGDVALMSVQPVVRDILRKFAGEVRRINRTLAKAFAEAQRAADTVTDWNSVARGVVEEYMPAVKTAIRERSVDGALLGAMALAYVRDASALDSKTIRDLVNIVVAWARSENPDIDVLRAQLQARSDKSIALLRTSQQGDVHFANAVAQLGAQHRVKVELHANGCMYNAEQARVINTYMDNLTGRPGAPKGGRADASEARRLMARVLIPEKYRRPVSSLQDFVAPGRLEREIKEPVVAAQDQARLGKLTASQRAMEEARLAAREALGDNLAQAMEVVEDTLEGHFYVPRAVRDALMRQTEAVIATARIQEEGGLRMLAFNFWQQAAVRGVFLSRPNQFVMDYFSEVISTYAAQGPAAAARMAHRSFVAQFLGTPGMAQGTRLWDAFRGKVPGTTARELVHALSWTPEIDAIFQRAEDVRIQGYSARELADIADDYGLYEDFASGQLTRTVDELAYHIYGDTPWGKLKAAYSENSRSLQDMANLAATRRRIAIYYGLIEDGFEPKVAAERAVEIAGNFADELHPIERGVFSLIFPFWSYRKFNARRALKMLTNPFWLAQGSAWRAKNAYKLGGFSADVISWYLDDSDEFGFHTDAMYTEPDPQALTALREQVAAEMGMSANTAEVERVVQQRAAALPRAIERYERMIARLRANTQGEYKPDAWQNDPDAKWLIPYHAPDPVRGMIPAWAAEQDRYFIRMQEARSQAAESWFRRGIGRSERPGDDTLLYAFPHDPHSAGIAEALAIPAIAASLGYTLANTGGTQAFTPGTVMESFFRNPSVQLLTSAGMRGNGAETTPAPVPEAIGPWLAKFKLAVPSGQLLSGQDVTGEQEGRAGTRWEMEPGVRNMLYLVPAIGSVVLGTLEAATLAERVTGSTGRPDPMGTGAGRAAFEAFSGQRAYTYSQSSDDYVRQREADKRIRARLDEIGNPKLLPVANRVARERALRSAMPENNPAYKEQLDLAFAKYRARAYLDNQDIGVLRAYLVERGLPIEEVVKLANGDVVARLGDTE